jgi:hypothetical protein
MATLPKPGAMVAGACPAGDETIDGARGRGFLVIPAKAETFAIDHKKRRLGTEKLRGRSVLCRAILVAGITGIPSKSGVRDTRTPKQDQK